MLKLCLGFAVAIYTLSAFLATQARFVYAFKRIGDNQAVDALADYQELLPSEYLSPYENYVGSVLSAIIEVKTLDDKKPAYMRLREDFIRQFSTGNVQGAKAAVEAYVGRAKQGEPGYAMYAPARALLAQADAQRASPGFIDSPTQDFHVTVPELPFRLIP